VIVGPRRAGKSFFAIHSLTGRGPFGYVNFDDEQLGDTQRTSEIVPAIESVYGKVSSLLLDEVQNLDGWELFVNRLSRQGYNLFITGSNAHLLSKDLATHLTGRHTLITVFPFSFPEFAKYEERDLTEDEYREHLDRYAESGGFPEPLVTGINRKEYLSRLFDAVIFKDIIRRYKVRAPQGLGDLAMYLCSNAAREYSIHRLAQVTGCKSDHTVKKYLGYLEEAFLFFSVPRFSFKVREQLSSNKKIYCIDNGFITAKGFRSSGNRGRLYENLVAVALKQRELQDELGLFYWKNQQGEEIDFVIQRDRKVSELIQVCADASDHDTRQREMKALMKAGRDLQCDRLILLTRDEESQEPMEWFGIEGVIQLVPLWKWLLNVR
jgi:predicted AAA+ superfamily ATPase